jgi:predicted DNA binding CopG/RHH family protein
MEQEYDLTQLKKRPGKVKSSPAAAKIQVNLRLDGSDLAIIRTEAERLGIPYQTLIGSILHRFATWDLEDQNSSPKISEGC